MRERMDEKKIERGGGKWREGSKGEKKRRREEGLGLVARKGTSE